MMLGWHTLNILVTQLQRTGVLPTSGKDESSVAEGSHAKPLKQSPQEGKLSSERGNDSCSDYDELSFESNDESSWDEMFSLDSEESSSKSESRSDSSELSSESRELNLESYAEFNDPSPEPNKLPSLQMCSESHKSHQTKQNKLSPRKKDLPAKKHSKLQDGENRLQAGEKKLPAVTSELHVWSSKSSKKPLTKNSESHSWKRKAQTGKNESCAGKTKPQMENGETHTGETKLPKLKAEPCRAEGNPHTGKTKQRDGKSKPYIKKRLLKGMTDAPIGKHEMQNKISPAKKSRSYAECEHDQGTEWNAGQKEQLDRGKAGTGYLRYTRRKVSSSKIKMSQGRKTKLRSPKSDRKAGNCGIHPQKSELQADRRNLDTGKSKVKVQKRELSEGRSNVDYQKAELHAGRDKVNVEKTELHAGRDKVNVENTELHAGRDKVNVEKTELHAGRDKVNVEKTELHAGQDKVNVENTEMHAGRNKINFQKNELYHGRNDMDVQKKELRAGKNKMVVQKVELHDERDNKPAPWQKELATETNVPAYTWKVPATLWLGPSESTARLFFGKTELCCGQVPLMGKKIPYGANQSLRGNHEANTQVRGRLNQLNRKRNLLPHINAPTQNGKTWSLCTNNQMFNPDVSCSCPRCSQCWFRWFHHSL
ncbi:uncharacterized protein LOC128341102 isoform X2 [Hemicordylus capensis]|uniref:uncharacterized protein LOC128341102 isoform X2 n=1 Tax=Hemicordylus capensis TaxID=884348 RepID=UPI0023043C17|nr:uncharacterized protein LOC128341102 isoform X2 [Hemicordylus capensis]